MLRADAPTWFNGAKTWLAMFGGSLVLLAAPGCSGGSRKSSSDCSALIATTTRGEASPDRDSLQVHSRRDEPPGPTDEFRSRRISELDEIPGSQRDVFLSNMADFLTDAPNWRRKARPTTCSHKSWVPKARTPSMCVTVLVSHPSVSIETETTHRTCSPSRPSLPTVFMTSRSRSWSVMFSTAFASCRALADVALELFDLGSSHFAEVFFQSVTGFQLLGINEQGVGRARRLPYWS